MVRDADARMELCGAGFAFSRRSGVNFAVLADRRDQSAFVGTAASASLAEPSTDAR